MTYTVSQLIADSYYLSSVRAKDLEAVSGEDISEGLTYLNFILSEIGLDTRKIPYYGSYDFDGVIGQETYFVPGLVEPETFVFFLNSIRYSMQYSYRKPYFGSSRADNVNSLPCTWHFERVLNGGNIYIYFTPDQQYPMTVRGRFLLEDVTLNQDLSTTYELFYIDFLRHSLAAYICEAFSVDVPNLVARKLAVYERKISDMSPFDLSMTKASSLQEAKGFNYGDINLGHSWRP